MEEQKAEGELHLQISISRLSNMRSDPKQVEATNNTIYVDEILRNILHIVSDFVNERFLLFSFDFFI